MVGVGGWGGVQIEVLTEFKLHMKQSKNPNQQSIQHIHVLMLFCTKTYNYALIGN